MKKITFVALSLALANPVFAAPQTNKAPQTSKTTNKKNTTIKTPAKPAKPTAPVLLSKTIVPDGNTPVANVKNTPVPDVSPPSRGQYVVINIPQQRLFLYQNGALQKVYPVAVGKAVTQTNLGEHKIGGKAYDPTWHIPKSIQAELKDGRTTVPPGPDNPLGPVFVRLGNPKLGLGIHGTNAPSSVPGVRSHGCVRMKSEQALDFARTINTGSDAIVSYEMVTLNEDGKKQLWLTAYKDPYSKNNVNVDALKKSIQAWASENNVKISNARINQILKARKATPICISCSPKAKARVLGNLMSIAWNSGSAALTTPKGTKTALPPVMPEENLNEIEVDADVPATKATKVAPAVKNKASKTPKSAPTKKALPSTSAFDEPSDNVPSEPSAVPAEPVGEVPLHPMKDLKPINTDAKNNKTTSKNVVKTSTVVKSNNKKSS